MKQQIFKVLGAHFVVAFFLFLAFGSGSNDDNVVYTIDKVKDCSNKEEVLKAIQGKWQWTYLTGDPKDGGAEYRFEITGNKLKVWISREPWGQPFNMSKGYEEYFFDLSDVTSKEYMTDKRYLEFPNKGNFFGLTYHFLEPFWVECNPNNGELRMYCRAENMWLRADFEPSGQKITLGVKDISKAYDENLGYSSRNEILDDIKDEINDEECTYTFENGAIYVGQCIDNEPNGYGTIKYTNGNQYTGEFKNGKRNGKGTVIYASGSKYIGDFKDNKFHGQGMYIDESGFKYEGGFINDKYDGQGTSFYTNGDKYTGDFKDGIKDGHGTYIHANGDTWTGEFKNDEPYGKGIYKAARNGLEFEVNY